MKTAVLLLNIGTPAAPTRSAVRRYLHRFLMDARVVALPIWARVLLVYGFIVPFRAKRSLRAYQAIWQPEGSPLSVLSQALVDALGNQLGPLYCVKMGMRYGPVTIETVLAEWWAVHPPERLIIIPLFPQYAESTQGSSVACVMQWLAQQKVIPATHVLGDFFSDPDFIQVQAAHIAAHTPVQSIERWLISYHGLPHRALTVLGCDVVACERQGGCPPITETNRFCYRAQCEASTALLQQALAWTVPSKTVFQSRLGRLAWLSPLTEHQLVEWARQGIKNLGIVCPSFVTDCLETLEEIQIRGQALWKAHGGVCLHVVPALNATPAWVTYLAERVRRLSEKI